MKPLTTMLMIGERERETATVVRVYCNTVNKYAYINLVSLSHSLSLSLATTCVRENDISLPTTSEEIPPARLYYTVYTQTRQRLFIESLDVVSRTHCGGFVIVESNFERVAFDSCVMFIKKFCQYNLTWFVSLPVRLHTHTHTQSI